MIGSKKILVLTDNDILLNRFIDLINVNKIKYNNGDDINYPHLYKLCIFFQKKCK